MPINLKLLLQIGWAVMPINLKLFLQIGWAVMPINLKLSLQHISDHLQFLTNYFMW